MSNMNPKLTKAEKELSLNQVIRFGCIYVRIDFLNVEDLC
jgi:hypothetical protein